MLKDPYNFNFIPLHEQYTEKELKDELMDKLSNFLLELGKGFSFVGREYRISAHRMYPQKNPTDFTDIHGNYLCQSVSIL